MADPNPRELAAMLRRLPTSSKMWTQDGELEFVDLARIDADLIAAALEKGADAIDALEKEAKVTDWMYDIIAAADVMVDYARDPGCPQEVVGEAIQNYIMTRNRHARPGSGHAPLLTALGSNQ